MEKIPVSDAMRIALLGLADSRPEYDQLLAACIDAVRTSNNLGDRVIVINPDHTHWIVS